MFSIAANTTQYSLSVWYSIVAVCVCVAEPYWVEKPVSQDVAENETGTFRCRGEGIPEPLVKWLINGEAVTSEFYQ